MILIFSESLDSVTTEVIEWLVFKNENFLRLNIDNEDHLIDIVSVDFEKDIGEEVIEICGKRLRIKEISFIWYRRGGYRLKNFIQRNTPALNRNFKEDLGYFFSASSNARAEYLA